MKLSDRQQGILTALIEEYVKTATPVGSQELIEEYDFPFSPATLRSEMSSLEEKGYLYQPHISAGRIPTDKGYRFFVNQMSQKHPREIEQEEKRRIEEELIKLQVKQKRLVRTLAKMLAVFSNNLAIAGLVQEKEFFESGMKTLIEQPDFRNIDEVCRIVELLDYLDENIDHLTKELKPKQVETFIGKENIFTESGDCAIVISQCIFPGGEKGIIAILGPKRMEYHKNISLLQYVTKFLETRHGKDKEE